MTRIFGTLIAVLFLSVGHTTSAQDGELLKRAQNGDVYAQYNLGLAYFNGEGVEQDYAEAAKWWRLAAEQRSARAQLNLGLMYRIGQGTIRDLVYSHMWFNIASSLGFSAAEVGRENVAKQMTPEQIAEAEKLARECVRKEYKDC